MRWSILGFGAMVACGASSGGDTGPEGAAGASGTASGNSLSGGGTSENAGASGSSITATGGHAGAGGTSDSATGGSGGSGGTAVGGHGGAGGAGGSPMILGNCDKLPTQGQWQNVSPPEALAPYTKPVGPATSGVDMVVVHPNISGTVYINGRDRGLFKSEDCGSTWKHLNTGTNGKALDAGGMGIVINPVNPEIIYLWANYGAGGVWKSTNGGVDWTQTFTGAADGVFQYGFVQSVAMDPQNPDHLVASPHGPCMGTFAPTCMTESHDGGQTWRIFKAPAWVESSGIIILTDKTWLYTTGLNGLFRTTDAGANWSSVAGIGGTYPQAYRSDSGKYYLPSGQGVLVNTVSDGSAWSAIDNHGLCVHVAGSGTNIYACNQWSGSCAMGPEQGPGWTTFASPPELPPGYGASNLAYDRGHHILFYTSTDSSAPGFQGGVWRIVTP